jgi:hypothetical protein
MNQNLTKKPPKFFGLIFPVLTSIIGWIIYPYVGIFLGGIIGGIIGYYIFRKESKKFAIIILIIGIISGVVLQGLFLSFIVYGSKQFSQEWGETKYGLSAFRSLNFLSASCRDEGIVILMPNMGDYNLEISEFKFYIDDSRVHPSNCTGSLNIGESLRCILSGDITKEHKLKVVLQTKGSNPSVVEKNICKQPID